MNTCRLGTSNETQIRANARITTICQNCTTPRPTRRGQNKGAGHLAELHRHDHRPRGDAVGDGARKEADQQTGHEVGDLDHPQRRSRIRLLVDQPADGGGLEPGADQTHALSREVKSIVPLPERGEHTATRRGGKKRPWGRGRLWSSSVPGRLGAIDRHACGLGAEETRRQINEHCGKVGEQRRGLDRFQGRGPGQPLQHRRQPDQHPQ